MRLLHGIVIASLLSPAIVAEESAPLTLLSPAGGENWSAGSLHWIRWKSEGTSTARVALHYSVDAGKTWQDIGAAQARDGKLLWKIPQRVGKAVHVRVQRIGGGLAQNKEPLAITPSREVKDYQWILVTKKAEFAPRDGAGALTYKGKMWFLGGWNPGDKKHFPRICNNEVWSSTDGLHWVLDKPNTFLDRKFDPDSDWEGRHTAGYVVYKDLMWIVGGDVNQGHYHFDVWNSSNGKSWTQVNKGKPVPWGPRALHYTLVHKDRIWVIGGQTVPTFASSAEHFYRDVWTTSDGITWEKITPREPYWSARGMIGGSVVFKDRIWILGGGTYDTPKIKTRNFYNDVWSTADGVSWTRHSEAAPWEPRQYHEVAVHDERMWVLEGYSQGKGNRNDVWYSADGVNWYEAPATPWAPRHAASVYVHDGSLWMVAGNNMQSDVWRLQRSAKR